MADINNERVANVDYIKRLQSLNKFVMVKFLRDTIVQPVETSWFGFYQPGSDDVVLSLRRTEMFTTDKLGLKQMMKEGKLVFIEVESFCIDSVNELNISCLNCRLMTSTSRFLTSGLPQELFRIWLIKIRQSWKLQDVKLDELVKEIEEL